MMGNLASFMDLNSLKAKDVPKTAKLYFQSSPRPPYSTGLLTPSSPALPNFLRTSCAGHICSDSHFSTCCCEVVISYLEALSFLLTDSNCTGLISASMSFLVVAIISFCSSL